MSLRRVIKDFDNGNVCVTGLRGKGKDLLFGNVIVRRDDPYISNLDYTLNPLHIPLDLEALNLGKNTYKDFIEDTLKPYVFPYPRGTDIYISDCGVYYPSQYCNELNKLYPYSPLYQALSRQVSGNNFHINVQNLNRAWDKIREQSDIYYRCTHCFYIPFINLVIQRVVRYDKYESCCDRVEPCPLKVPLLAKKEVKQQTRMYLDNFRIQYGKVRASILIYHNKSKHDTYYFEKILKKETPTNEEKNPTVRPCLLRPLHFLLYLRLRFFSSSLGYLPFT